MDCFISFNAFFVCEMFELVSCIFSLIKSLGLKFSNSGSNRRYGNVPFTYENSEVIDKDEEKQVPVYTAHGHLVANMKKTGKVIVPVFESIRLLSKNIHFQIKYKAKNLKS